MNLAWKLGEGHDAHADAVRRLRAAERREHPRVLLVAGDDLIARSQREPRQHGVDSIRGGVRQRDLRRVGAHRGCVAGPRPLGEAEHLLEVGLAGPPVCEVEMDPGADGVFGSLGYGTLGTGIQVGITLEHRKLFTEAGSGCRF